MHWGDPERWYGAAEPKLGDPGVCPDCGATDQTGKFCEFCGAKIGE